MTKPAGHRFEANGDVLRILLDSPPANVLDRAWMRAAREVLESEPGRRARLVVFESTSQHFSYGASIPEHLPSEVPGMLSDFRELFRTLSDHPAWTLSWVEGRALGGGLELALFTDFLVVSPSAELGFPEVKLGVFAPMGTALSGSRFPPSSLSDLLRLGTSISGGEAYRRGLATYLTRESKTRWLERFRTDRLDPLPRRGGARANRLARSRWKVRFFQSLKALEDVYLEEVRHDPEAREGIQAFLEKRPPNFSPSKDEG